MKTECSHCKSKFTAGEENVGKKAKCPKCGQLFTISALEEAPLEASVESKESAKKKDEVCSECEVIMGPEQQACVYKGNIVCERCYNKMTDTGKEPVPAEVSAEKQVESKKSLKTLYVYCWAGTRIIAGLVCALGLLLAIKRGVDSALIATFAAGDVLLIGSVLIELAMIYKMWAAIQDGNASVSPAKAVGFLFVPVFNIYWALYMFTGFAEDYNSFVGRHKVKTKDLPLVLFLIYAVMFLLSSIAVTIPMLCIFASPGLIRRAAIARPQMSLILFFFVLALSVGHFIVYIMYAMKTCNAIKALPGALAKKAPGNSGRRGIRKK